MLTDGLAEFAGAEMGELGTGLLLGAAIEGAPFLLVVAAGVVGTIVDGLALDKLATYILNKVRA